MKESHLTVRLPAALARALAKWAAARGIPKSQVAREAVQRYLAPVPPSRKPEGPEVTARELAVRWRRLPRLRPEEAESLAQDLAAARAGLPAPPEPWGGE